MPDIEDIADLCQLTLADSGGSTWPQATVEEWVLEAIRDYSTYLHHTKTGTINTTTGTQQYDLPVDVIDIIQVEYPTGEDPPEYHDRLPRTDPRFWAGDHFYDLELYHKTIAGYESQIYMSAAVETGEAITITYLAAYYDGTSSPIADVVVLVPDPHIPIIISYVEWKAASERLFDELQDPDRTIHLIEGMRKTVETKRGHYEKQIAAVLADQARSGWVSRWHMDDHDRIY